LFYLQTSLLRFRIDPRVKLVFGQVRTKIQFQTQTAQFSIRMGSLFLLILVVLFRFFQQLQRAITLFFLILKRQRTIILLLGKVLLFLFLNGERKCTSLALLLFLFGLVR
jgi:hypothetical protein